MDTPQTWSSRKHLRKVQSIDILIKRRSVEPVRRTKSLKTVQPVLTPRSVDTPKRRIRTMSPNGYIEIVGSPESKKYSSARKIDFNG